MHQSTKTYDHCLGLTCAFRQWRTDTHCRFVHGYALAFKFVFQARTLDHRNWVIDFGALDELKTELKIAFDHKTVVAFDDPHLGTFRAMEACGILRLTVLDSVGCEAFAKHGFDLAVQAITRLDQSNRVMVVSCEVSEHGANSAIYLNEQQTGDIR